MAYHEAQHAVVQPYFGSAAGIGNSSGMSTALITGVLPLTNRRLDKYPSRLALLHFDGRYDISTTKARG